MSDEYLWDRTGFPEADELELEALLAPLGLRGSATPQPAGKARPSHRPARAFAALLAAAACIGLGLWLGSRSVGESAIVADVRVPPAGEPTRTEREHGVSPTPIPAGSAPEPTQVVDPWASDGTGMPRSTSRPLQRPSTPSSKPDEQGVLDPWGPASRATPLSLPPAARPDPGDREDTVFDPWGAEPRPNGAGRQPGLSPSQLQQVVAQRRGTLASACWSPALDRAAADAPATARVSASLSIAPDGRVESATPSSDPPGYPGLARCVATQMKGWSFPVARERTSAAIPIVFSR